MAAVYGLKPDPWQKLVLCAWLAVDRFCRFLSGMCCLAVPRQNGKNGILEMIELYKMVIQGRKILHTAHEVKTCRKAFLRLKSFFENKEYPDLADMVSAIRQTNGQEAIILKNGSSIEFIARSKSSGRGFSVDDLVLDEAQELTDEQLEALLPTLSASPSGDPQTYLTGTPPDVDSAGEVFKRMRNSVVKDGARNLCWIEWSVEEIGDVRDESRWADTNPALGYRISRKVIEDELAAFSDEGFARERLGFWAEVGGVRILGKKEWDDLGTENPPEEGKIAYGVKFSVDGQTVSVAAAVKPKRGTPHVEVTEYRSMTDGITWLADYLDERRKTAAVVVIDGLSGAGTLIDKLEERKFPSKAMIAPRSGEVATAASSFLDAIHEKKITHFDQPQLNEAALNAQKRPIGKSGAWGWGGIGDVDVTPVEACTLAYWGAMTTKRNPGKGSRIL